ncbi:hypothetical protein [Mycolicibacterium fortuitum]|uniref:hypothetical protein n=1 Tax=Mycolicibacterium fortuitum TaxID=1766 RepID=UPI0026052CFD|nr:hypothetical protein [Mycolicibacterium fortuitum]
MSSVPEFPERGNQIPDAPGPHPDDFWGGGGCGFMALAFKNLWPDLTIAMDVDNKDGTVNHAWVHDGNRAHDFMGTHPDPDGPAGMFGNETTHMDVDPQRLADLMRIKWSPEEPWGDDSVHEASEEIEKHWLGRSYNADTGEYEEFRR